MAIRQDAVSIYKVLFSNVPHGGRLMTFGRPTVMWEGAPSPEEFFRSFGFSDVHSLDVSPYEGATFVHDLNDPRTPQDLVGRYDYVLSGGTIEHVFSIQNSIKVALDLLRIGGAFLFGAPCNNWIDHGFYQVSPTLKFDYALANDIELGTSWASLNFGSGSRRFLPLYPGEGHMLNYVRARVGHDLVLRKTEFSTTDRIPKQGLYVGKHEGEVLKFRFRASEPFDLVDGLVVPHPTKRVRLTVDAMRPLQGRWAAKYQDKNTPASLPARPFRSKALVYEEGLLMDWIVSDPTMVSERLSTFCHFPGFVHFSTKDGSDPRTNGRRYEIAFPASDPNHIGLPAI